MPAGQSIEIRQSWWTITPSCAQKLQTVPFAEKSGATTPPNATQCSAPAGAPSSTIGATGVTIALFVAMAMTGAAAARRQGLPGGQGAVRLLYRAVVLRSEWRVKVAFRKIDAANQIFQNLPAQTCPA